MGNCKDCRSYVAKYAYGGRKWQECEAIRCLNNDEEPGEFDAGMEIEGTEILYAAFRPGPLFGCVQFQLRSAKELSDG